MTVLNRERFLARLAEFEAGYVVGHLGGVGVWYQLLTALYFEHDESGEGRLLLGEAFFTADKEELTPRNACIIPWQQVQSLKDEGGELIVELPAGRLRIIPADSRPNLDWLERRDDQG